ncbi:relaxase/mobilization nuclease domain-containing protein [Nocardia goodfellowii]|uniref:MobA/VirD2-like nuclease domain-containing protein n=1 Tax=Nocardia goodfellowii TaxID=882446 RepID=A0ABS4QV97_9NOCA|nr:hypothetical protein [Nocardia goodfellowii]MBP2194561.1 hypothetical protein [Nocardia goodfellowii]
MIPKIRRGKKMSGLITYLLGPGEHNEHRDRHIIGGSPTVMREMWLEHFDGPGDDEAARDVALAVADEIEIPRRLYQTQVRMKTKVKVAVGAGGSRELGMDVFEPAGKNEKGSYKDAPVWHCVLALAPGEELSDDRWQEIADTFMDRMGFTGTPDGKRAQARWVAVRHGHSGEKGEGQDHVHIAASLVRDDGRKVSTFDYGPGRAKGDWRHADQVCGELEREFGLKVLASRREGGGMSENSRAEIERAKRLGTPETERERLRRMVRAYATAAESEREFVTNLRAVGVAVRARYAPGGTTEVIGYSVRLRRGDDEVGPWLGGGKLAKDLSLSALREQQWIDSPEGREDALSAWMNRTDRTRAGRDRGDGMGAWAQAAADVEQWREQLAEIPVTDRAQWAWMAGQASGVFAAWSEMLEGDEPGQFAAAAREMARSAQVARQADRWRPPRQQRPSPAADVAHLLLQHTAQSSRPRTHISRGARDGQAAAELAVLLLALMLLLLLAAIAIARAVARAHRARGELVRATSVEHVMREQIDPVRAGWESELQARRDQWDRDAAQVFTAAAGRRAQRVLEGAIAPREEQPDPKRRPTPSEKAVASARGPLTPPVRAPQITRPIYSELSDEDKNVQRLLDVSGLAFGRRNEVQPRSWNDRKLDAELQHRRREVELLEQDVDARRNGQGPHTVAAQAENAEYRRQADRIAPARRARAEAERALAEQRELRGRQQGLQWKLNETPRRKVLMRRDIQSSLGEVDAALAEVSVRLDAADAAAEAAVKVCGIPMHEWDDIEFRAHERQQQSHLRGAQDKDARELVTDAEALQKLRGELKLVETERTRRSKLTPEQRDQEQQQRVRSSRIRPPNRSTSVDPNPSQTSYRAPGYGRDTGKDQGMGR